MKKSISYSAYEKYHQCPKKYDYYYNQKLRPDHITNHLLFGSATDKALNTILEGGTDEAALQSAQTELSRLFTEKITLDESDFDSEIITEESNELLIEKLRTNGWKGSSPQVLWNDLFDKTQFGTQLSDNERKALGILAFFSFLEKISLIIQAWHDYVEPQIEEIVSVQKYVKRGILDFEIKLKDVDGVILADNKTSSRDYEPNSVKWSVQLAGYGAEKGCYIVFNKTVRKNRVKTCSVCNSNGTGKRHKTCDTIVDGVRCNGQWDEMISPEIIPQIIVDDISQHTRDLVEDAFLCTEKLIERGEFPRNLSSCGKQFGKPCEYFNLCWNNDMKGLVKRESSGRTDK